MRPDNYFSWLNKQTLSCLGNIIVSIFQHVQVSHDKDVSQLKVSILCWYRTRYQWKSKLFNRTKRFEYESILTEYKQLLRKSTRSIWESKSIGFYTPSWNGSIQCARKVWKHPNNNGINVFLWKIMKHVNKCFKKLSFNNSSVVFAITLNKL